jgi:hypothetical protein
LATPRSTICWSSWGWPSTFGFECEDAEQPLHCILTLSNNMSAIGWLFTSSKFPSSLAAHKEHLMVACQLATLVLQHDHCLTSRYLKGKLNTVADLLSFLASSQGKPLPLAYDNPLDNLLTQHFHQYLPSQIPANFKILRLPN